MSISKDLHKCYSYIIAGLALSLSLSACSSSTESSTGDLTTNVSNSSSYNVSDIAGRTEGLTEQGGEAAESEASIQAKGESSEEENTVESGTSQTSDVVNPETSTADISDPQDDSQTTDPDTGIIISDTDADTTYGNDALMQIVVIGDSQFGNFNGTSGIAYQLSQYCHANVYNMAIGGTCAALKPNDSNDDSNWDSQGGIGMSKLLTGEINTNFLNFPDYQYQLNVYNHCDLSKTDVFIVEYGVNDFLAQIPLDKEQTTDESSYRGALKYIIMKLTLAYPNAKVVICTPIYSQFFDKGTYIGDSNTLNYGYGTLYDYVKAAVNVVETSNNNRLSCMQAYTFLNVTAENAHDNLIDGIHMNDSMRAQYSQVLSRIVIRAEGYSIGEGVDPSTVEWWTTK